MVTDGLEEIDAAGAMSGDDAPDGSDDLDLEDGGDDPDEAPDSLFLDEDSGAPNLVPEGPPPRVLAGRIEILAKIGEGGMGAVWRGHHLKLDHPVAVKILDDALQVRADSRERFIREARALAKLIHRNVVLVHDCDELADGRLYLCMELLEGETLRAVIKRGERLDPLAVIDVGLQICDAVQAAHERGILHRDLTPSNIMRLRDEARTIKVIDWGLCKYLDLFYARTPPKYAEPPGARLVTPLGCRFGTPEYMAPEMVLRDNPHPPSFGTDVYALAVVLFELLTGRHPFPPGDRKQPRRVADLLPGFEDLDLEDALRAALRFEPDHRTPTMAAFRESLELARECSLAQRAEHEATSATRGSPAEAPKRADDAPRVDERATSDAAPPPRAWRSAASVALGVVLGVLGTLLGMEAGNHVPARTPVAAALSHMAHAGRREPPPPVKDVRSDAPVVTVAPSLTAPEPALLLASTGEAGTRRPTRSPPRARPTTRTFAEAMARLQPQIRACAQDSGAPEGVVTVQVRRKDGALEAVKVLKFSQSHPFAVCVVRVIRGATLPPGDRPIEEFSYFE